MNYCFNVMFMHLIILELVSFAYSLNFFDFDDRHFVNDTHEVFYGGNQVLDFPNGQKLGGLSKWKVLTDKEQKWVRQQKSNKSSTHNMILFDDNGTFTKGDITYVRGRNQLGSQKHNYSHQTTESDESPAVSESYESNEDDAYEPSQASESSDALDSYKSPELTKVTETFKADNKNSKDSRNKLNIGNKTKDGDGSYKNDMDSQNYPEIPNKFIKYLQNYIPQIYNRVSILLKNIAGIISEREISKTHDELNENYQKSNYSYDESNISNESKGSSETFEDMSQYKYIPLKRVMLENGCDYYDEDERFNKYYSRLNTPKCNEKLHHSHHTEDGPNESYE